MAALDWTVVRNAVLGGVVVIVPVAILSSALVDVVSPWTAWPFLALTVLGFATAGWLAGWSRSDTPMLHGAVAAAATFVVVQLVGVIAAVTTDGPLDPGPIIVTAVVAVSCGVGGALLADWTRRRRSHARFPGSSVERQRVRE